MVDTSMYALMGGWEMYYEAKGEGDAILFIHGTPTSAHLWRNQVDHLSRFYRVYAIDLPGWGRSGRPENFDYKLESYAEIVRQFLETVGEEKVILGIHDLGAAIGMTFYGRYPEMVSKLILFDTFAYLPFTKRLGWKTLYQFFCGMPVAGSRFHRLIWYLSVKKSDVFATLAFDDKKLATKELVEKYRELAINSEIADYKTFTVNGIDSIWGAVERNSLNVTVPTLILWAENDMLFPTSAAEKLHRNIKDPILKTIPECGHWLQEEKPEEVNGYILEFLASKSPVSSTYIKKLRDISRRDIHLTGGKAAALGELARINFPVPEGFVLTTAAFEHFLRENSFTTDSSAESVANGRVPDDVLKELTEEINGLGNVPVVVRSSGVAEDLFGASFAGQYVTVLNVRGASAVINAVKQCWASVFSKRVAAYRTAHGQREVSGMAVLIQNFVQADAAGVAFTADPVTGDLDVTVVSAVRGLGERLVSGQASPDEWQIRENKAICKNSPEGAINEHQALAIAELARQAEKHFGKPQDIEWAIANGKLFMLQSRPITTLSEQVSVPAEPSPGFWQREATHYPHPLSPMFGSVQEAFNASVRRASADFSILSEGIEFREIGGWVYQRMVPLGGRDIRMPPRWLMPLLIRVVPQMRSRIRGAMETIRSDKAGSYIERWYKEWKPELMTDLLRLREVDLATLSDKDLNQHLVKTIALLERSIDIHTLLNFAVLVSLADIGFACRDLLGWDERKTLELFGGLSEKSSEPARRLAQLAQMAKERPAIRRLLERIDGDTEQNLGDVDEEFAQAFSAYLREFGARTLRIEMSEQTLAEAPVLVLRLIRDQLARGYDPSADLAALEQKRGATAVEAKELLASRSVQDRERFERALRRGERAYPIREDNQFYTVSSPMALLRYAVLELGSRLADNKQIEHMDDVFFFRMEEARRALETGDDQHSLVKRRKAERDWVIAHPGPPSYGKNPGPPPALDALPSEARFLMEGMLWALNLVFAADHTSHGQLAKEMLRGIAASPGIYAGPVRVIMDESEFNKLRPGDVLVCPITSPVWSVLFASVGALVTDTGGILSHPAIIAREYRVPAVVATGNATSLFRDGQIVVVDGNNGTVEIKKTG